MGSQSKTDLPGGAEARSPRDTFDRRSEGGLHERPPAPHRDIVFDTKAAPVVLKRIIGLALRRPLTVLGAILCSLLAAVAGVCLPRLYGIAIDQAQHLSAANRGAAQAALWATAALVIGATLARGCLTGLSGFLAETASQRVAYDLRQRFFIQLQRLPFAFHDKMHSGEMITRGMLDLEATRSFIQGGMMQSVALVLLVAVATSTMVMTDWRLAVVALTFVPVVGLALARMGLLLRRAWLRVQETMAALTLTIEESLQGARVVRAFASKAFEMVKFDGAADLALFECFERIRLRLTASAAMNLSFYAAMTGLLWYGGHRVVAREITAGRLTEFLTYMMLLQAPLRQITLIVSAASRTVSSGARLFEILDLEPEIQNRPDALAITSPRGHLRFERVSFGYAPDALVLEDVSFELSPGRTLGVVGPPGSGKSTIANLVPRFYDVTGGRITLDGIDIRDIRLEDLRRHVGLVQQDAFLFDESIGGNVAYAQPGAADPVIEAAARTGQIHDHIAGLPQGYASPVGERGVALSGGQRQRLSIARGLLPDPCVMIFDDSTAAVDAATERRLRHALARASQSKATIIISHRLSALMHADEILVLDAGRIVERGTHGALVGAGGLYARLHALQSRRDPAHETAEPRTVGVTG